MLWFEHTAGGTGYQLGAHHTLLDGLFRLLFGGFSGFGIGFAALQLSWVLPVPSVSCWHGPDGTRLEQAVGGTGY